MSDTRSWGPKVAGYCPMGCGKTLFLGVGGHVTCAYLPCPDPGRADSLLHNVNAPRAVTAAGEQTNERTSR